MNPRFRTLALLLAAALPVLAGDTYRIDPAHSEIGFKVRHFLSKTPGRFSKFQGTIQIDEKDVAKSSVEVSIETASVNTDNASRDSHLRTPDFFDVEKFPAMTFRSTSVREVSKGKLEVTGDLTLRGVTKRITFPISNVGVIRSPFGDVRAGFVDGVLKINRKDFGVSWNKVLDTGGTMLSDEVEIALNVEAVKQEPKQPGK